MSSLFGRRYGEVLLVRMGDAGPEATVFNTYPLNDCPAELWNRLDAQAIAAEHHCAAALLNGPRYWLMSRIEKVGGTETPRETFGGIEMLQQATVSLSSMNPSPYSVNEVDRKAVFVYDPGTPVFELIDPEDRCWVMQTYSQTVDPELSVDDLPGLGDRLNLPDGWRYRARTLDQTVRVETATRKARVLQDDLANSYSLLG
ncbi:hypothetical protein KUF57_07515 [Mycolicibacterium sp. PAM1]|uniref:Uncharacterized protein n=4 Tax=Mycobacteriaceae TaxID=1762 RepID=E6TH88_MYCSR|nr:conserved hypothetical protein [Mycolicibacterium gilvum PYR-GCK]ADT99028.1 hypothetical protein Mspyr1_23860 [Mycolicibacterium gilvum Spyr1]MBV5243379.1 hypothetical protein [Mycolicibacterium sp. PAM1]MCV7054461.1 hypothetical protein [Mycolicibacterium gilvum]STZ44105.1 Uncharacterised protein [Mycolicibacterium gilvum]